MKEYWYIFLFLFHTCTYTNDNKQINKSLNSRKYTVIIHDLHAIAKHLDMFLSLQKYHQYVEHRSTFFLDAQRLITEASELEYIHEQNPLTHTMQYILQILSSHITNFINHLQTVQQLKVFPLLVNDYACYSSLFAEYDHMKYEAVQDSIKDIINILHTDHQTMQQIYSYERQLLEQYKNIHKQMVYEQQKLMDDYSQHFSDPQKLMLIVQATEEYQALTEEIKQYLTYISDKEYELSNFEKTLKNIVKQLLLKTL